jgi:hypothetical protein
VQKNTPMSAQRASTRLSVMAAYEPSVRFKAGTHDPVDGRFRRDKQCRTCSVFRAR